jgi:hypothetical protein
MKEQPKWSVYWLVVKFRNIDQDVLEAVQNDVEGEEL